MTLRAQLMQMSMFIALLEQHYQGISVEKKGIVVNMLYVSEALYVCVCLKLSAVTPVSLRAPS